VPKPKRNRAVTRGRRRAPQFDAVLTEHASAIRALSHRVIEGAIEIGRRLADAKERAGHGHWLKWLRAEIGWSPSTAENLIRLHGLVGSGKFGTVANLKRLPISLSALYVLARKSTPEEVRDQIVSRAEAREPISRQVVVSVTHSTLRIPAPYKVLGTKPIPLGTAADVARPADGPPPRRSATIVYDSASRRFARDLETLAETIRKCDVPATEILAKLSAEQRTAVVAAAQVVGPVVQIVARSGLKLITDGGGSRH
jgi:hypothetical protein